MAFRSRVGVFGSRVLRCRGEYRLSVAPPRPLNSCRLVTSAHPSSCRFTALHTHSQRPPLRAKQWHRLDHHLSRRFCPAAGPSPFHASSHHVCLDHSLTFLVRSSRIQHFGMSLRGTSGPFHVAVISLSAAQARDDIRCPMLCG